MNRRPDDAGLRADLAQVLEATQAFDSREHADVVNAERAAADAASKGHPDARLELLAARLQQDENVRRRHLDTALAAAPDLLEARVAARAGGALAGPPGTGAHPPSAHRCSGGRPSSRAQVLLARAEDDLGDSVSATRRIEGLPPSTWRIPDAGRERVRSARVAWTGTDEALERLRGVLAVRPGDGSSLSLARRDPGRPRGRHRCRGRAAQRPPPVTDQQRRPDAPRRAARLQRKARGRADPVLRGRGALPRRSGDLRAEGPDPPLRGDARSLRSPRWTASLALRPQNPALRDAVRALHGTDAAAASTDAIDIRPLVAEADSYSEDAVYLADVTRVRVQQSGLSSRFHQLAVKVYTQRGVDAFRSFPITYSPEPRRRCACSGPASPSPTARVVESFGDSDRNINEPWTGMYYDARAKVLTFPGAGPRRRARAAVPGRGHRAATTCSPTTGATWTTCRASTPKLRYQYVVDMPAEPHPLLEQEDARRRA